MENLSQSEKVAIWIVVLVVAVVFVIFSFFRNNQAIQPQDGLLSEINLEGENMATGGELITEDTTVGEGEQAETGNTVTVHYTGRLSDGTVFDSSLTRGEPFTFTLGEGQVIAGWEQGILGMREGGVRVLTIPPSLGYGPQDYGPIPGNSTLIFEVELLEIN